MAGHSGHIGGGLQSAEVLRFSQEMALFCFVLSCAELAGCEPELEFEGCTDAFVFTYLAESSRLCKI